MLRTLALATLVSCSAAYGLDERHLALVINASDPASIEIGEYYAARRHLLFSNVIRVRFAPGASTLTRDEFNAVKESVDEQTPSHVQAFALAWTTPYRVECMSITSAFAFGFHEDFCAEGCTPTRSSPYYDSAARLPFARHNVRPAMMLAAASLADAKALIDRGVRSDGSTPAGTAYLLSTSDSQRNVRARYYQLAESQLLGRVTVRRLMQDDLFDVQDVLFYFTGVERVSGLETINFLPGAIADHLTSSGGQLIGSPQMSALRWLEAGATGSYGTVVEPCNMPQKFPHPAVVARHYLAGETLIEAYWKGVAMPGQGVFIGEPLAAPFRRSARGP